VDCGSAREAISALLDEERLGVEREALEAHLVGCSGCRRWREEAHRLTRRVRLAPVQAVPPPGEQFLATVGASSRPWRWSQPLGLTRLALVAVALAQIAWVRVPTLIFGTDRRSPIHVAHEMGSFDVALAVGFLVAAWRPARAHGMRTLVGAAALLLVATAVLDLVLGRTTASDEAPHLLAVAGWLLLHRLAELTPTGEEERALPFPVLLRSWRRAPRTTKDEALEVAEDGALDDPRRREPDPAADELAA
jgi:predicted anti-sigma-YlaC factor YlaD